MKTTASVVIQREDIIATRAVEVITLQMDMDTALALSAVLRNVGGHPEWTNRGLIDTISRALVEADVYEEECEKLDGSVYFTESNDGE